MYIPYRIAIVLDRTFGDRLLPLAQRLHVWICDTPLNRASVKAVWRSRGDRPHDIESGATIFTCSETDTAETMLLQQVGTLDLHHGRYSHSPPWSVIEVVGMSPTPTVVNEFANLGANIVVTSLTCFEARR
jgi:hypothetical protein